MESNGAQQSQPPAPQVSGAKLSFMDGQFANMSGCGQWFIVILVPFIGLILGVIGLLACKDEKARSRSATMAIVGGIWFVVSTILFLGMVGSPPR